jgi:hypothetical protein
MNLSRIAAAALLGAQIVVTPVQANAEVELSAHEHFVRGVEASRQGDLARALQHFESAQALNPNPKVLYNLGQTYTALGRPVEALRAFDGYLETSTEPADSARQREVEELVRKNEALVGTLVVNLEPQDAQLEIDGRPAEPNAANEIRAAVGRRLITATRPGYHAAAVPVEVPSGESRTVGIALERKTPQAPAFVTASCATPKVAVFLDDAPIASSALANPIAVASGEHRIRFERHGYRAHETSVLVIPNATVHARCALAIDPALSPNERSELRVGVNEPKARIIVDGSRFQRGKLPLGPHSIEVAAAGYETWRQIVTLRPGTPTLLEVTLEPTAERRLAEHAHTRRIVTYAMGGAGLVLGGVAAVLFITNENRYDEWQSDRIELLRDIAGGDTTQDDAERLVDLQERGASIQRTDDIALGAAVLGGALLSVSLVLLLTEDSTDATPAERAGPPLGFRF